MYKFLFTKIFTLLIFCFLYSSQEEDFFSFSSYTYINKENFYKVDENNLDFKTKIKNYVNQLNSTSSPEMQFFATNQLIKLGKKALPYLHDYLLNDKRTYVRIQIANILGKIKDPSSINFLEKTALTDYNLLNKSSIKAISEIGTKKAIESLKKLRKKIKDEELIKLIDEKINEKNKN